MCVGQPTYPSQAAAAGTGAVPPTSTVCNYLKAVSNFFSNMESTNFYLWVFLRESKAPTFAFGFFCKNEKHQLLLLGFFAVKKSNKLLKKWTFLCQSPEI